MNKHLKNIIQLLIFLGLGVFFIWLSVKDLSKEDLDIIKQSAMQVNNPVSWTFLVLSMLSLATSHFFRSLRSVLLIEPLNYKIRTSMSFYAVMVCYLANLALPRLGEVLRCTFLQRYEKVPFQKSLGTIVTERVIDLTIFLIIFILAIFLNTGVLSNLIINQDTGVSLGEWMNTKIVSMASNHTLYLLAGGVVLFIILIYLTRKQLMKIPFMTKVKNVLIGIWQGLISIKDVKKPFLFVLYTLLIWVFYFFGTYTCFFAFDFLSQLGFIPAFSCLAFGAIGFMIAQGGLGAYPLIIAGTLVLYGVDYNAGLAAGWIGWSTQTLMVIIFGFISLLLASFAGQKSSEQI